MTVHQEYPASVLVRPWEESEQTMLVRFSIRRLINTGGASYCYEAYHPNSGSGVLKEFRPNTLTGLQRNQDGQVYISPEEDDASYPFAKRMEAYVQSYRTMLEYKQRSDPDVRELASFIPPFEIYRGCSPTGDFVGTAYIWVPLPEYTTFDQVCKDIRNAPAESAQHKLVLVLKSMAELAGCTAVLHKQGLLHRDIKPANLGFMMRNEQLLEQTLSFFDLDTLCFCDNISDICYSEGFTNPDVLCKAHLQRTADDIYSIGATLFHALDLMPDIDGYHNEYYSELRQLVEASPLIRACHMYAHPNLIQQLTHVLQRCLGGQTYRDCDQLRLDLVKALQYIMPEKPNSTGKWIWHDIVKKRDRQQRDISKLALQYHLYQHPLYECASTEQLNVLILGFGYYGQTFMDSCLQMGQLPNKHLCITAISDDTLDKSSYLSARPELQRFVSVDGELDSDLERYADIHFFHQKLICKRNAGRRTIEDDALVNLFMQMENNNAPQYIMVALGDDDLNIRVAEMCLQLRGADSSIHFVWESVPLTLSKEQSIYPIYVNEDVRKQKAYRELERMAFNAHYVWQKSMNVDFNAEMKAFQQSGYHHHSSMDYILALKCKLHSFDIDLAQCTFTEAAERIDQKLHEPDNLTVQSTRNTLIWLEHRRWVLEKVCNGWRAITNLDECVDLSNHQDKANKRHACICRSAPNLNLSQQYCQEGKPIKNRWDGVSPAFTAIQPLDELDTMSLELHRSYLRAAEKQKQRWYTSGKQAIDQINQLLEPYSTAWQAWQEFLACMNDICQGDQRRTYHYHSLKHSLEQQLDAIHKELDSETARKSLRDIAEKSLGQLDTMIQPFLASSKYQDFKHEDVKLVDEIPFILTFATPSCMVVPYVTGNSSMLFSNIAAALKVNPTHLTFLYHCATMLDVERFTTSIGSVIRFMQRKNITAKLEICITCHETIAHVQEELEALVNKIKGNRWISLKVMSVDSTMSAVVALRRYLQNRKKRGVVYALEENESGLSWLLQGAGIYDTMAHYRFDAASMTFTSTEGCPMFRYIHKNPFLSVADIMALADSGSNAVTRPEFFTTYRELWNKSRENNGYPWKNLCGMLKAYSTQNDVLAVFNKRRPTANEARYVYSLAAQAFAAVEKILHTLKEQHLIGEQSEIVVQNMECCHVTIYDRFNNQASFNNLFRSPNKLFLPENITLCVDRDVKVCYDDFSVLDINLSTLGEAYKITQVLQLLEYLRDKGLIYCYTAVDQHVSFSYASGAVKQLLTSEGRILEVYVYHKLKDSSFDDVVCGYEVSWRNSAVRNELDCIVTKGFHSLFIECKARTTLSQEHYFKIEGLTKQFGINVKAVLIADTREKQEEPSMLNAMQRTRGDMLGVLTIWKEDEIKNIDNTLLSILEGSYKP